MTTPKYLSTNLANFIANPSVEKQLRFISKCCNLPPLTDRQMHLPVALPSSARDSAERPFLPVVRSHLWPDCYRTLDRCYQFLSISRSPYDRNFSIQDTVPCCLAPLHVSLERLNSTVFKIGQHWRFITSLAKHINTVPVRVSRARNAFNV